MSNSSDQRSTESEDGEIEREPKYKKSKRDRGHGYKAEAYHHSRHKKQRKSLTPSPDLQSVSDDNNSAVIEEEEEDEVEEEEEEELFDESNEESLDIKPPQAQTSKSYSSNSSNYRNRSDRPSNNPSKDSNRPTNESPFKQKDNRYRERHRHRPNRYGDNRSGRSDDDLRRRRREEDTEQDYSGNRARVSDKEKTSDRWMVLDERSSRNRDAESGDNWKSKSSDQTSNRLQRDRYSKEVLTNYEKQRKASPKIEKNSKPIALSPSPSTQKPKQSMKKLSAMIEVQEVELSEEEILSEEHNSVSDESHSSKSSEKNSERSDNSEQDENNEDNIDSNEKQELSDDVKESNDNESRNPRIVVDREVVYYQQSNSVERNVYKSSDPIFDIETMSDEIKDELPPYYPAIQGCRSVEEFQCINRIEEGTYGVVYRARDKRTNETVALKRLKMEKEKEGFPITSLREISTLLKAQHQNIVTVREIVVGSNMDKIYIVMEFVEHDLKSLMETMKQPFLLGEVKTLMLQLLRAVAHLHDNWILHRDLKTSNLLLSHKGILKVFNH